MNAKTSAEQVQDAPRPSLVEDAYAALRHAIRESEFPPGHQVSGQELALRFGMSRTPIHEACLRLQEEGLVRILPKRGILICALAPDDMREIFDVIVAIESEAAALAAALEPDRRAALADALDAETARMEDALVAGDLVTRGHADDAFHRVLVENCGNSRFARIMRNVNDQCHRARVITVRMRPDLPRSVPEHRAISAAIREGDTEAAFAASRAHRVRARDEILPLIAAYGLKHL